MLGFSGEAAMATNAKGVSRVRRSIILTIKSVVPLVEVAALGYVAFAVVEEIRPLLKASTKYALESEMSEAINTTAMPNPMPIEGGAAAAVPIRTAFTTRDNSDLPDR
jgi:hypothetical protein